jgi:hypothetical protein
MNHQLCPSVVRKWSRWGLFQRWWKMPSMYMIGAMPSYEHIHQGVDQPSSDHIRSFTKREIARHVADDLKRWALSMWNCKRLKPDHSVTGTVSRLSVVMQLHAELWAHPSRGGPTKLRPHTFIYQARNSEACGPIIYTCLAISRLVNERMWSELGWSTPWWMCS